MPTTNPRTQVAEEPEPTLRDVLVAVNGIGTRLAHVESDVAETKVELATLKQYTRTQFTQQSLEIANLRADVHELRMDVKEIKIDVIALTRSQAAMAPLLHESLELGRSNRDALRSLKEDVALLTSATEGHHGDHEIHVPRARSADGPLAGPMAA